MQKTLFRLATLPSIVLIGGFASAQPMHRDLRIVFNSEHYVSTVYSGSSVPGTRVYFDDEPLRLQVGIANWSDETLMLRTGGTPVGDLVSVRLYRHDQSGPVEVPVRLMTNGEPVIAGETDASVLRWEEAIAIPSKWHVTIPMLVQTDGLEPGTYELRLDQVRGFCEPKCRVRNHAGLFGFEISNVDSLPKQLDRLLRRADEAIERGTMADADLLLKRVLELHPEASAAYQLLARRAERLENWKEAAAAYERALELFETKADRLRPHREPQALIGDLREKATEARQRPNRQ